MDFRFSRQPSLPNAAIQLSEFSSSFRARRSISYKQHFSSFREEEGVPGVDSKQG